LSCGEEDCRAKNDGIRDRRRKVRRKSKKIPPWLSFELYNLLGTRKQGYVIILSKNYTGAIVRLNHFRM